MLSTKSISSFYLKLVLLSLVSVDVAAYLNESGYHKNNKNKTAPFGGNVISPRQPRRFRQDEYGERVVLASYPRSGNSMLRKILEDITGIHTGTDLASNNLRNYGFQEETVDSTRNTWIVKSHF